MLYRLRANCSARTLHTKKDCPEENLRNSNRRIIQTFARGNSIMAAHPLHKSGDISGDGVSLIASSTAVVFLAVVAVVLRFWSRSMGSQYGADDWTILLGLFLVACLYSVSVTINTIGYGGFQQSELTTSQLEKSLMVRRMSPLLGDITIHCRVDQDTS